jgi:hypothetical protein
MTIAASLIVLCVDFGDKIRALFIHNASAKLDNLLSTKTGEDPIYER